MTLRPAVAVIAVLFLACLRLSPAEAHVRHAPAPSGCAVIPISLLDSAFGEKFNDQPVASPAVPAYAGATGMRCVFSSKPPFARGHETTVDFLVYQEASSAEAKEAFNKIAVYLADKSKPAPAVGDSTYWQNPDDTGNWLHVLKGKTHFMLSIQPTDDKKLVGLATAIVKLL